MTRRVSFPLAVALALSLGACGRLPFGDGWPTHAAASAVPEEVVGFGVNPGGLKMFRHVPAGLPAGAPLVVALHGCSQRAADYAECGWSALADQHGFAVLYPEQTSSNNSLRCFRWYDPTQTGRGLGETASIDQMVAKMIADVGSDRARVYVTGLSAGGAMSAALMATMPDVFAAGAPVAGLAFGCAQDVNEALDCMDPGQDLDPAVWAARARDAFPGYAGAYPRASIWHGTADQTVVPKNEDELVEQWTALLGAPTTPIADGVGPHVRLRYGGTAAQPLVEAWKITGADHGVFVDPTAGCGTAGPYRLDVGLCAAERIATFFGVATVPGPSLPSQDGGAMRLPVDSGGTSSDGFANGEDAAPPGNAVPSSTGCGLAGRGVSPAPCLALVASLVVLARAQRPRQRGSRPRR